KERSLITAPYIISFPVNYSALARVNPAGGAAKLVRDVTLDPGWTFQCSLVGPDGKPLVGARSFDLNREHWWEREPMKSAQSAGAFTPRRPYEVLFQHGEKGLVGVAQPPKVKGGTLTVRMAPGAAVTGRLVDAAGRPRAGVELGVSFRPKGWQVRFDY